MISRKNVSLHWTGEAYFDIRADENHPFVIRLNDKDHIKVLGTSFHLINEKDAFDLIVYSGTVELHTLNRSIILEKNDRISRYEGAYVKLKNHENNALSWKSGVLRFNDTPLKRSIGRPFPSLWIRIS